MRSKSGRLKRIVPLIKFSPKHYFFALIFLIFLILTTLGLVAQKDSNSKNSLKLSLIYDQNRFKLLFDVSDNQITKFNKTLSDFGLPRNLKDGLEFELDTTSSAKLAFTTPIASYLIFKDSQITFSGTTSYPQAQSYKPVTVKLPQSTNFAVFASNFEPFFNSRFGLPSALSDWFSKNLFANHGQYIAIFGQDAHFAIISRGKLSDLESLKNIHIENTSEPIYKEESQENTTYHLIKLPKTPDQEETTLVLFEEGEWLFLCSSPESASHLAQSQKSQTDYFSFPSNAQSPLTAYLVYRKNDSNSPSDKFFKIILGQKPPNSPIFEKIDYLEFSLKSNSFSGLINLQ